MLSKDTLIGPACWVCGARFKTSIPQGSANEERHHIMPRNAGGTDGPEVSLCSTHHGTIHKIASRVHRKAPITDLLAGEEPAWVKKLLWLASCVVKAERATEGDPNKRYQNGISLRPEEIEMIKRLQTIFPGKGRSEIIRAALFHFFRKNFPNV
jgi:hypothetical protein